MSELGENPGGMAAMAPAQTSEARAADILSDIKQKADALRTTQKPQKLEVKNEVGAVVGQAILGPDKKNPGSIYIRGIEVNEGERGKGYGQRLIEEAINTAAGKPLSLEVRGDNTVARKLYEKNGFVVKGTVASKDGTEYLRMKLDPVTTQKTDVSLPSSPATHSKATTVEQRSAEFKDAEKRTADMDARVNNQEGLNAIAQIREGKSLGEVAPDMHSKLNVLDASSNPQVLANLETLSQLANEFDKSGNRAIGGILRARAGENPVANISPEEIAKELKGLVAESGTGRAEGILETLEMSIQQYARKNPEQTDQANELRSEIKNVLVDIKEMANKVDAADLQKNVKWEPSASGERLRIGVSDKTYIVGEIVDKGGTKVAEVDWTEVEPGQRGKGKELLRDFAREVKQHGAEKVTGDVVHPAALSNREKVFGSENLLLTIKDLAGNKKEITYEEAMNILTTPSNKLLGKPTIGVEVDLRNFNYSLKEPNTESSGEIKNVLDNTKEVKEFKDTNIKFETRTEKDITEADIAAFEAFIAKEKATARAYGEQLKLKGEDPTQNPRYHKLVNSAAIHAGALESIKTVLDPENLAQGEKEHLLVTFAKDSKGNIVGYKTLNYDSNLITLAGSIGTARGVGAELNIGEKLLEEFVKEAANHGLTKFDAHVWRGSRQLYERFAAKHNLEIKDFGNNNLQIEIPSQFKISERRAEDLKQSKDPQPFLDRNESSLINLMKAANKVRTGPVAPPNPNAQTGETIKLTGQETFSPEIQKEMDNWLQRQFRANGVTKEGAQILDNLAKQVVDNAKNKALDAAQANLQKLGNAAQGLSENVKKEIGNYFRLLFSKGTLEGILGAGDGVFDAFGLLVKPAEIAFTALDKVIPAPDAAAPKSAREKRDEKTARQIANAEHGEVVGREERDLSSYDRSIQDATDIDSATKEFMRLPPDARNRAFAEVQNQRALEELKLVERPLTDRQLAAQQLRDQREAERIAGEAEQQGINAQTDSKNEANRLEGEAAQRAINAARDAEDSQARREYQAKVKRDVEAANAADSEARAEYQKTLDQHDAKTPEQKIEELRERVENRTTEKETPPVPQTIPEPNLPEPRRREAELASKPEKSETTKPSYNNTGEDLSTRSIYGGEPSGAQSQSGEVNRRTPPTDSPKTSDNDDSPPEPEMPKPSSKPSSGGGAPSNQPSRIVEEELMEARLRSGTNSPEYQRAEDRARAEARQSGPSRTPTVRQQMENAPLRSLPTAQEREDAITIAIIERDLQDSRFSAEEHSDMREMLQQITSK